MESGVTLIFYLAIGFGVAVALWQSEQASTPRIRLFQTLTAPIFWPFYISILLSGRMTETLATERSEMVATSTQSSNSIEMSILQAESELDTTLRNLDGPTEAALAGERQRIVELRSAWRQQDARIRELDQVISNVSHDSIDQGNATSDVKVETGNTQSIEAREVEGSARESIGQNSGPESVSDVDRFTACENVRLQNIRQLRRIRNQLRDDLVASLACVRQLVTTIHLAKYTGAPASRTVDLVQQIAAALNGLSPERGDNSDEINRVSTEVVESQRDSTT